LKYGWRRHHSGFGSVRRSLLRPTITHALELPEAAAKPLKEKVKRRGSAEKV
jgi:hypothetical protein